MSEEIEMFVYNIIHNSVIISKCGTFPRIQQIRTNFQFVINLQLFRWNQIRNFEEFFFHMCSVLKNGFTVNNDLLRSAFNLELFEIT